MKIRNLALCVLLCALPSMCGALAAGAPLGQLVITEVMYDPAGADYGHEWIELYNAGTSSVSLPKYKLVEDGVKHAIVAADDSALAPHGYAVIAQNVGIFRADYPDFSGELYHSAISLNNSGETIELLDASSTFVAGATYYSASGASGDGNSLQRPSSDDNLVARAPSPGAPISATAIPPKTTSAVPKKPSSPSPPSSNQSVHSIGSASYDDASAFSEEAATASAQVVAADDASGSGSFWWWVAAAALALASAAAMFFAARYKKREWDIVEES